ncbi:MAG: MerR family transcriptional regulator [Holophaga sp.]|nr:MerR family transcriptional regulator [Holophaga sp.]
MTDKIWFKIGETAALVGATPKELRYWERVIPELKPRRSKGNLRYYHQDELAKLQRIRQWLTEGFTVADCRTLLQGGQVAAVSKSGSDLNPSRSSHDLAGVLSALRALHQRLGQRPGEAKTLSSPPPTPRSKATLPKKEPAPATVVPAPTPKRPSKPKPDLSALGRMWTGGRLPLDWEE